jgi:hypothetical protein
MEAFSTKSRSCKGQDFINPTPKGLSVQLVLSLSLGVSAFLGFCVRCLPAHQLVYLLVRRR